jgi:hypothetical protein
MSPIHRALAVIAIWASNAVAIVTIHGAALNLFTPPWALVGMTVAVSTSAVCATWYVTRDRVEPSPSQ